MSKELCSSDEGTPDPPDESSNGDTPHCPPRPIDEWGSKDNPNAAAALRTSLSPHAPSWSPAAGFNSVIQPAAPIICRFFAAGTCRFGDACRHHHPAVPTATVDALYHSPSDESGHGAQSTLIPQFHMTLPPPAAVADTTRYAGYRLKRTAPAPSAGTKSQKVSPQLHPQPQPQPVNPYQGHRIHLPEGYPEPLPSVALELKEQSAPKVMKGHNPYAW